MSSSCRPVRNMVREINASEEVIIPEGVSVEVKARHVIVKGKRGTLERSFKHISVEMSKGKNKKGQDCIKVRARCSAAAARNGPLCYLDLTVSQFHRKAAATVVFNTWLVLGLASSRGSQMRKSALANVVVARSMHVESPIGRDLPVL